ncbi:hypothetical protein TraAM80_00547 [Trypanosoma rangeli]|uniref:Uncharacterized protein n=1 Tax=Trypanosoma rangeli TaxID=5698 RepID=A0A3R7KR54_TRYRA|nr:uncharacterized protein TraAM80_00547 [Trypanosoma rangeli]RNF11987.1 hypothetical protein TraAM80_00547 [Trypanosoma rangeli]|eukprot:RNF11987.1 hypothetical protein TraAM80_00547 [Trypanosoma rangeli]
MRLLQEELIGFRALFGTRFAPSRRECFNPNSFSAPVWREQMRNQTEADWAVSRHLARGNIATRRTVLRAARQRIKDAKRAQIVTRRSGFPTTEAGAAAEQLVVNFLAPSRLAVP